jgi:hypothetical protein
MPLAGDTRDQLDKRARFYLLQQALKAVTDLAAHPEVDQLEREDASAVIITLAGLLRQLLNSRIRVET